jgi:hypothetical protein
MDEVLRAINLAMGGGRMRGKASLAKPQMAAEARKVFSFAGF